MYIENYSEPVRTIADLLIVQDDPRRRALAAVVRKVAGALGAIDAVDNGEAEPGSENASIDAVLQSCSVADLGTIISRSNDYQRKAQQHAANTTPLDETPSSQAPSPDEE